MSAVFIYRLSNWCYMHKLTFLAILLKHFNIIVNHCEVAYQAEIGQGFRIYHAIGIVIAKCEIGENFKIFQNSTIGTAPKIGNNVTFFAGSVVNGFINIGNNVQVGANTVVLKDMQDNSKALGGKTQFLDVK
ncbi:hypothetical protein VL03_14845 [Rossellomorea marisflavi]|nr:hypothetical protein VL03_14845 [Rossellomorea marisflavi]